jgi:polysaccharide export outer membrane protein
MGRGLKSYAEFAQFEGMPMTTHSLAVALLGLVLVASPSATWAQAGESTSAAVKPSGWTERSEKYPVLPEPHQAKGEAQQSGGSTSTTVSPSALHSSLEANVAAPERDKIWSVYRVGVGDVLQVNVWREPEVSVPEIAVRSDGMISLPLLKEVQVLGLTPADLETLLKKRFSAFINEPDVTIIVKEIRSQKIYVIGGVGTPGSIQLEAPITVLQALAVAGGLSEFAKRNKIHVLW